MTYTELKTPTRTPRRTNSPRLKVAAIAAVVLMGTLVGIAVASIVGSSSSTPGVDNQRAYIEEVAKVDPSLVVDEKRAITRAETVCRDLNVNGLTEADVIEVARFRLTGGDTVLSTGQAAQVVALVKRYICT